MTSFNLAFLRNKLAFSKHKWYVLLNINEVLSFDVKAFGQLGAVFRPIAAGSAAVALAASPFVATTATAQEAKVYSAAASTLNLSPAAEQSVKAVTVLDDADQEADMWVVDRPGIMAVSVAIGPETMVPIDKVEGILRSDLANNGVSNVQFFYEMGRTGETTISYHSDGKVWGPYNLGESRQPISQIADQFQFNTQMAMRY